MLSLHPAPGNGNGMGIFIPANWTIPENPISAAFGLGEIVDGIYNLPANPIVGELNAKIALAEQLQKYPVGLSCGPSTCPCQVGLCGISGLGVGTVDDILNKVTGGMGDWKTWAIVGGGVLALVMLTGGGGTQRRSELSAAKAQYKAKVAQIRASRPRRYQKLI